MPMSQMYIPYLWNKMHLFRWQEYKNHSFALTAEMLMLCPFFYQSSLFVTEWESWPRTQNDDKQPTISKSGNSQITAHASVNDPLAEKAEWYQGKSQTQSVAFLQRMQ